MNSLRPSLLKIITLLMISSLAVACNPTPKYTKEECNAQAQKQEYAKECFKHYPPGQSYFVQSGGNYGGYSGGGYYSPVKGKPGSFAPVKAPSFSGRSGFGSFGRGGFGLG
jgi:hypothetical protein